MLMSGLWLPCGLESLECCPATYTDSHQKKVQRYQQPGHNTALRTWPVQTHIIDHIHSMKVKFEAAANANVYFVRMYLQCAVLVSVNLHVAVAVSVQWCEHDAEGSSPMTEEHEQTVSQ